MGDDGGLFDVEAATPRGGDGPVVRAFDTAVARGWDAGTIVAEDQALVAAARVMARALDVADQIGGMKGGYLVAQGLPPFQRALHALRLPAELTAVAPPAPSATAGQGDAPDWASDYFGTAE